MGISRQPEGIPTGGQFAASAKSEPDVALAASDITRLSAEINASHARRRQEALRIQTMSAKLAALKIREELPEAARLSLYLNDTEDGYWIDSITDADGNDLPEVDENDYYNELNEFPIYSGDVDDVDWAEAKDNKLVIDLDKAAAIDTSSLL